MRRMRASICSHSAFVSVGAMRIRRGAGSFATTGFGSATLATKPATIPKKLLFKVHLQPFLSFSEAMLLEEQHQ